VRPDYLRLQVFKIAVRCHRRTPREIAPAGET
jgi:hypothetical protein